MVIVKVRIFVENLGENLLEWAYEKLPFEKKRNLCNGQFNVL